MNKYETWKNGKMKNKLNKLKSENVIPHEDMKVKYEVFYPWSNIIPKRIVLEKLSFFEVINQFF